MAIKAGNKVVWQINDLDPAFMVGNSKSQKDSIFNKRRRYIIRKIAKKVDAITVNVSKNADRVRKLLKREASVLYCGVDKNSMLKRHCFCAEKNEFRLLSMGVFFPYRNYETLILLINRLRKEGKNIRLDIIGNTNLDQGYFAKIKALVSEYKLNEYIKIWGQVDEEGYADLFNRADAFAFVNIDQSWGLAVFEAMSCGLPTVVSNSVGATELLHNGVDSMIVEPTDVDRIHDIVGRLMEDAAYYNKISRAAADTVKEYSWDALYSSKLLEIIKTL